MNVKHILCPICDVDILLYLELVNHCKDLPEFVDKIPKQDVEKAVNLYGRKGDKDGES